MKRRRRPSNRSLTSKLDRLARLIALEQAGYECQRCASIDKLQWSHIVPRHGHKAIQWAELNTLILCLDCHVWFDRKATDRQRVELVERLLPGAYDWLEAEVDGVPRSQMLFKLKAADMEMLALELNARLGNVRSTNGKHIAV